VPRKQLTEPFYDSPRTVWATRPAGKHHQLRVIDESGEDYLYPEEYFVPVQLSQAAEKAVLRAANLTSAK
jgi:hypothetical protein